MKFSILICSIETRKHYLERLLKVLCPQTEGLDEVEVLVHSDNGEISIGAKRNILIEQSQGEYVSFVDDDDLVSENYVKEILKAIESRPDCVGIEGIMTTNGRDPHKFIHSLRYKTWFEEGGVYYRNPNHLNPIKWEIASKVPFKLLNFGEDSDFSKRALQYIKNEVFIEGPIYFYEFRTSKEV